MVKKVLQIGYEPERDRLTWDGWDIHCGQGLDVLLPDRLGGGTWRPVSFEYNSEGWYMPGCPGVSRLDCGPGRARTAKSKPASKETPAFSCFLYFYIAIKIDV